MLIVIPGDPIAQARVRFRRVANGDAYAYDPQARDKAFIKRELEEKLKSQYPSFKPFKIPDLKFIFYMPIPRYLAKAVRELAVQEKLRHVVRPDTDNIMKLYLDCLLKIIIEDDRSANILGAQKLYSPRPRVEIIIYEGVQVCEDMPPHGETDSLICGTPTSATIDVPTYSECPHYLGMPQLHDKLGLSQYIVEPSDRD